MPDAKSPVPKKSVLKKQIYIQIKFYKLQS